MAQFRSFQLVSVPGSPRQSACLGKREQPEQDPSIYVHLHENVRARMGVKHSSSTVSLQLPWREAGPPNHHDGAVTPRAGASKLPADACMIPWREAGPPNHHDDKVACMVKPEQVEQDPSEQHVVDEEEDLFFTLVTGCRRSLRLKLSDTGVYEPQILEEDLHAATLDLAQQPPWRQPRGKTMISLGNSHTNITSKRQHLWEIDLRFAPGLPPGWHAATLDLWYLAHKNPPPRRTLQ